MAGKVFDRLLRHFVPDPDAHLQDETMADLFCRELSPLKSLVARRHLARCEYCRLRQEDLEGPRAERMLRLYRDAGGGEDVDLTEKPRTAFARWLELQTRLAVPRKRRSSLSQVISLPWPATRIAAVSLGAAIGLAIGVSGFSFWRLQGVPRISANTLLARAEKWEAPSAAGNAGIARQRVQIKTTRQTMERSLYWDLQGKRRPKQVGLQGKEEQVRSVLARAGIDWDQPISASAYQAWHDHQPGRADRIIFASPHLLTLTTTVREGAVLEESLTVRDTDFHPVRRTVNFRDSETVEIAELDYKMLPWSAVDASAFAPIGGTSQPSATAPNLVLSPPHFPETQSLDQLDETELAARLILNQLHADTGEQIDIHRSAQAVEVTGLVETDERKRELRTQLMTVPRLKISIQSVADTTRAPVSTDHVVSIQAASLPDDPSALETYLRVRGRGLNEINAVAQKLFNGALTISHESKAIVDLGTRFAPEEQRPVLMTATLADLLYSHRERLDAALRQQRMLLAETQGLRASGEGASSSAGLSLADAAARNLALAKELTQTNAAATRSAETIFADMSATADMLAAAEHEGHRKSQSNTAHGGKN